MPSSTTKSTPSSAVKSPNRLTRPSATTPCTRSTVPGSPSISPSGELPVGAGCAGDIAGSRHTSAVRSARRRRDGSVCADARDAGVESARNVVGMELVTVAYGRPAAGALRDAIASGKHGDPLAPVSVVVPTNYVGVAARRMLGSGALGPVTDRGVGIAGVTFLTVYRVAELLGAPRLAGARRCPVSTAVLGAAVRRVLSREPGMFVAVAEHPATEQALVDVYRELSQCDHTALDRLADTGRRAADVVRVFRAAWAAALTRLVRRTRPDGQRGRRRRGRFPRPRRPGCDRPLPAAGAVHTGSRAACVPSRNGHRSPWSRRSPASIAPTPRSCGRSLASACSSRAQGQSHPPTAPRSCPRPIPTTRCGRRSGW